VSFFFLQLLDVDGAPVACGRDDPELDALLEEPGVVTQWDRLELTTESTALTDYLANDLGVRLCSLRMREVVDACVGEANDIQWLEAVVTDPTGCVVPYWVLHVAAHHDVLDPARTITARGGRFVVKPVIDTGRAEGHRVFAFPGASTRLVVSGDVRDALQTARCTGIDFAPVPSA
jgi:hypothetical protein